MSVKEILDSIGIVDNESSNEECLDLLDNHNLFIYKSVQRYDGLTIFYCRKKQ